MAMVVRVFPAPIPANKPAAPRRPSTKHAPTSVAWRKFSAKRTEADYQAWRDQRDWTARKYAMWDRGELMPSQKPNSMMRCRCGTTFDSHKLEHTLIHVPHITAAGGI